MLKVMRKERGPTWPPFFYLISEAVSTAFVISASSCSSAVFTPGLPALLMARLSEAMVVVKLRFTRSFGSSMRVAILCSSNMGVMQ